MFMASQTACLRHLCELLDGAFCICICICWHPCIAVVTKLLPLSWYACRLCPFAVINVKTCPLSLLQSIDIAREWATRINSAIRQSSHRPHSLLVLLNPFGGAKKARAIWRDIALPVLNLAGELRLMFQATLRVYACQLSTCQTAVCLSASLPTQPGTRN